MILMKLVWTWFTCCGVMAPPHILHSHLSLTAPSNRPPSATPNRDRIAGDCSHSCENRWPRHRGQDRTVGVRAPSACSRTPVATLLRVRLGCIPDNCPYRLLETAGRAEPPHAGHPDRLFDLLRGGLVDVGP